MHPVVLREVEDVVADVVADVVELMDEDEVIEEVVEVVETSPWGQHTSGKSNCPPEPQPNE